MKVAVPSKTRRLEEFNRLANDLFIVSWWTGFVVVVLFFWVKAVVYFPVIKNSDCNSDLIGILAHYPRSVDQA